MTKIVTMILCIISTFSIALDSNQENISITNDESFSLQKIFTELCTNGMIEKTGLDKDLRPSFVMIQALVEHLIAEGLEHKKIVNFVGAIHTPTPTTPLCIGNEGEPPVTQEIQKDSLRFQTVQIRKESLRNILKENGKLFVVYPRDGMNKRSAQQQKAYREACKEFPSIIDRPIDTAISDDMIGATYLITETDGRELFFSIQATQANDARDHMTWKLWLCEFEDERAQKRLEEINKFLEKCANCSLRAKDASLN